MVCIWVAVGGMECDDEEGEEEEERCLVGSAVWSGKSAFACQLFGSLHPVGTALLLRGL